MENSNKRKKSETKLVCGKFELVPRKKGEKYASQWN